MRYRRQAAAALASSRAVTYIPVNTPTQSTLATGTFAAFTSYQHSSNSNGIETIYALLKMFYLPKPYSKFFFKFYISKNLKSLWLDIYSFMSEDSRLYYVEI